MAATLPVTPISSFIIGGSGAKIEINPSQTKMDCTVYNVATNSSSDVLFVDFNQDYRYFNGSVIYFVCFIVFSLSAVAYRSGQSQGFGYTIASLLGNSIRMVF